MLMVIARKQFQNEMQLYDIKEILWGRTESPFTQLFELILRSQKENTRYLASIICSMLHKFQKFLMALLTSAENRYGVKALTKNDLLQMFDFEGSADPTVASMRLRMLIDFEREVIEKIVKTLDPQH